MPGLLGAYASSIRPEIETEEPLAVKEALFQLVPPSVDYSAPVPLPEATHLLPLLGSKATSSTVPLKCLWVQVAPPSVLRQIPVDVAARITKLFAGLIAMRLTHKKFGLLAVKESCAHVMPPSVVLKMPAP